VTAVFVAAIYNYMGLSTDGKPTTGVPAGSHFYETDTGATYTFDGTATWSINVGEYLCRKSLTFTGAAGLGAVGNVPLFTVTGEVEILRIMPYTVDTLTQAAAGSTLALGVTNATALFLAATPVVNLATGEFWTEATGAGVANSGIAFPAALKDIAITSNIVGTVAVNNCNGGTLRFDIWWRPLSSDGKVVPV